MTDTPVTHAARRHALALLLRGYRPRPGTRDNELLRLARGHGLSANGVGSAHEPHVDDSNPFMRFDPAACVHCWRCVRACERLNGVAASGVFARGAGAHIGFGLDQPMGASTWESCGMCEAVCPTGALGAKTAAPSPDVRTAVPRGLDEPAGRRVERARAGSGGQLHPADAATPGIMTGDRVRVSSRRGSVCVRARLTPGIAAAPCSCRSTSRKRRRTSSLPARWTRSRRSRSTRCARSRSSDSARRKER